MSDRRYEEPPALAPETRAQMVNALYEKFYANALPREAFDQQVAGKSDFEIANQSYDTFYKGRIPRDKFNQQVGLTSASGSTQGAIMSGMTFGLTDEVSGLVSGAASALRGEGFGTGYDRTTRAMRENAEIYRQNNPYVGRGAEIGGAVIGGVPRAAGTTLREAAGAALPAVTKMTMARQGAGLGAASGFGDAEGGLTNRLEGAATGMMAGAALPPLVAGATALTAPLARGAANLLGMGNPVQQSERQLAQALMRGGQTTGDVRGALAGMPADKPITLADIGGPSARAMGATVANRPGAAMTMADELVQGRRAATPDRIASDVDRMIAPGSGTGVADATQALMQQRSQAAAPLYEAAFSQPAGMTARLREFVDDPIAKAGLARGIEIQRLENLAAPPGQRKAIQDAAIEFAEDGTPKIVGVPNMRTLDAVKRGLDDMLETYRGPDGRLRLDQRGRAIEAVRKSYLTELDKGSAPYAEARAAWAGPSQAMDAINLGRKIVSGDRDTVARALEGVNESNRDFFRLGVARALTDRTTDPSAAGNFVRRMMEDRNLSGKIRSVFDSPEDYEQFVRSMQAELLMRDTNRAISPRAGSQTARLLAGMDDVDQSGGGLAMDLLQLGARGGKPTWEMASRMVGRAKQGSVDTAEQIGQRLFTPDRERIGRYLSDVDQRQAFDALRSYEREQLIRKLLDATATALPQQIN